MNTLHIDEQLGWRGGEQQASYLIGGLARLGHSVVIAGRRGSAFLSHGHNAPITGRVSAPFRGEIDPWTACKLARAIHDYRIDIIHAHTSHAHTYACLARALAGRGKVVVSRRVDFVPKTHAVNRWKYAQPDRIIAISERIAEVMRSIGVSESRLATVYSGVDTARFDVEPLAREALGIPENVPLLGNVAALVGHKDHATLIEAMPAVLDALPSLHLVIVGEGGLRGAIEDQIARLNVGRAVHLLGFRRDVPHLLRALDAFVLSSKEEGLGTSVLDAMACRVPVVATAGGGIPEMVKDGETGRLVAARDPRALAAAIVRVFQEPQETSAMAARGRALVDERFSVVRMVEGNLRVYEELLSP